MRSAVLSDLDPTPNPDAQVRQVVAQYASLSTGADLDVFKLTDHVTPNQLASGIPIDKYSISADSSCSPPSVENQIIPNVKPASGSVRASSWPRCPALKYIDTSLCNASLPKPAVSVDSDIGDQLRNDLDAMSANGS